MRTLLAVLLCGVVAPEALLAQSVPPIVFVQRQINDRGTIYWSVPGEQPGVGAHSRVRPAIPGRLLIRESDGTLRTLVDGARVDSPLVDVNAPAVSWDGTRIAFAGLPRAGSTPYDTSPAGNPGAWRIYEIRVDGGGLRQITRSDVSADYSQFGPYFSQPWPYDDYDPYYLPDGRLVFSSTRWPAFGHYSGVLASQLWVVNADGTHMHRITSERNGADRPLVDPVTGRIVYSRWWRNHRFPRNEMGSALGPCYTAAAQHPMPCWSYNLGLTEDRSDHVGSQLGDSGDLFLNAWQAAFINPDGTGLAMFNGKDRDEEANHYYGGSFAPDGTLIGNFFPMYNMTEAAGFGGLRKIVRGPHSYVGINGVYSLYDANGALRQCVIGDCMSGNSSFGVVVGEYTSEPEALGDGRLVFSRAPGGTRTPVPAVNHDFGIYVQDADGSNRRLLVDLPGTSEVKARAIVDRSALGAQLAALPIYANDIYKVDWTNAPKPQFLPPVEGPPGTLYERDGTFVFDALNIYFNAPVDTDIISAPAIGSAATIRFFADFQRRKTGSFSTQDWPILLGERAISPDGRVTDPRAPAFLPLFEQLRSSMASGYRVPLTGGVYPTGAAHVGGMNFNRAGAVARCVGCHAGHTLIPVPESAESARWSNLAPGSELRVSSTRDPNYNRGLIDRRVLKGEIWRYWTSAPGQNPNAQWVELRFPVPIVVRTVRLYDPRPGGEAGSTLHVGSARVILFSDRDATQPVAEASLGAGTGGLTTAGVPIPFPDVLARSIRVEPRNITGTFYGAAVASLAEVEVIARGAVPEDVDLLFQDGFE